MDLVSYSSIEAYLAAQGLAVQAGILDHLSAYRYLLIIFVALGLAWTIWRGALQGGLTEVAVYFLMCVILWYAIPVRVNVSVAPQLPPEEKITETKKQEIEKSHGVNFAFAIFAKLLDSASTVAAKQIANVTSADGYIRVTGSYAEGVAQILQARLPDNAPAKGALRDFFLANKDSCREFWERYAAPYWNPREHNHLHPWFCAIRYMYDPETEKNRLGYQQYQSIMRKALDNFPQIKGARRAQFQWCINAPEEIYRQLHNTLYDDLVSGKISAKDLVYGVISSAAIRLWHWISGGGGEPVKQVLVKRLAAKNVWALAAPSLADNDSLTGLMAKVLTWIKDRWGVVEGTAQVASIVRYAPMARGAAKALLYSVFPFICLFLFLPSGWSWMRRWARMMVAVYLWQILDMIALSVVDDVAWRRFSEVAMAARGVDLDPHIMLWVQSLLLAASPVLAYFLSGVSGGTGVEGAIRGPGVGAVARAAAAGMSRMRRR